MAAVELPPCDSLRSCSVYASFSTAAGGGCEKRRTFRYFPVPANHFASRRHKITFINFGAGAWRVYHRAGCYFLHPSVTTGDAGRAERPAPKFIIKAIKPKVSTSFNTIQHDLHYRVSVAYANPNILDLTHLRGADYRLRCYRCRCVRHFVRRRFMLTGTTFAHPISR